MQKNLDYEMKEKYFKHFIQKMRKYHFHCQNLNINNNFIQDAYTAQCKIYNSNIYYIYHLQNIINVTIPSIRSSFISLNKS